MEAQKPYIETAVPVNTLRARIRFNNETINLLGERRQILMRELSLVDSEINNVKGENTSLWEAVNTANTPASIRNLELT